MRFLFLFLLTCFLIGTGNCADTPAPYGVDDFIKRDIFTDIKLSPTGEYYAATVPAEGRTVLAILRRSDKKMTAAFARGRNTHIAGFWWVNHERLLISVSQKIGALDEPRLTGELYAVNVDGTRSEIMVGQGVRAPHANRIRIKKVEKIAAFLVDDLVNDDSHVIISTSPFSRDPTASAEILNVYTGRRTLIVRAPNRNAQFFTDNNGSVRFAFGGGVDNVSKTYYRDGDGAEWQLLNDEAITGIVESPIGFSEDNRTAYLQAERKEGPDILLAMDIATKARKQVLGDDHVDPERIIFRGSTNVPVGAYFSHARSKPRFFDEQGLEARLHRGLEVAFPGENVIVTSYTSNGKLALVHTYSDRNPGQFFVFDIESRKAIFLIGSRSWFDRDRMSESRSIAFAARDGLVLNGFLTVPRSTDGKKLPMIVIPHGGPFGVYDRWEFNDDNQLLAATGYAVLQVNFRGSGNYGRAFRHAGARQWGRSMQDDVTDATRWAVDQGIADANRICIYGASYGAYAALMGVAKEPALYRCAVGYVGVYDLALMYKKGDIQQRGWGEAFLKEWVGEGEELNAMSPVHLANRIKAPVFLVAGGMDERVPFEHSRRMERALLDAGAQVETLYDSTEGHGFYVETNQRAFYTRLLAFFARHLQADKTK